MKVQVLVAAMQKDPHELVKNMNLSSDAIIINQCDKLDYEEFTYRGKNIACYSFPERGIGKSRNNALMRADRDICLFSDEDIVYEDGYEARIIEEFERNPKADMIVFNIAVREERQTYHITERKRVRIYNSGRYGAVSFAIRTQQLQRSNVMFSLLFGGGAEYSSGEDSLFIREFMKKGYRVYTAPVLIGKEVSEASTWFNGYSERFFFDRGVLYYYLYGKLASVMALRFLLAHRAVMCQKITAAEAFRNMCSGIKSVKSVKRSSKASKDAA